MSDVCGAAGVSMSGQIYSLAMLRGNGGGSEEYTGSTCWVSPYQEGSRAQIQFDIPKAGPQPCTQTEHPQRPLERQWSPTRLHQLPDALHLLQRGGPPLPPVVPFDGTCVASSLLGINQVLAVRNLITEGIWVDGQTLCEIP